MLRTIGFAALLLQTALAGNGRGNNGNGNGNSEANGKGNAVGQLSTAIDALEESVGSLQTGSSGLQSQIDALNMGVDAIQPQLQDLQDQIDELDGGEPDGNEDQMDDMGPDLSGLQSQIDEIGPVLTGLQQSLDDLECRMPIRDTYVVVPGIWGGSNFVTNPLFITSPFCVTQDIIVDFQVSAGATLGDSVEFCVGIFTNDSLSKASCDTGFDSGAKEITLNYRRAFTTDSEVQIGVYIDGSSESFIANAQVGVKIYDATCVPFGQLPDDDCSTDDLAQA